MKYLKDIDLQGVYSILNYLWHSVNTTEEAIDTLQVPKMSVFDNEAQRLLIRDDNGIKEVAYMSDIAAREGNKVFYITTQPDLVQPAIDVSEGDLWYNPNDASFKVFSPDLTWVATTTASNAIIPNAALGYVVQPLAIIIQPTSLSLYQNRTNADVTISDITDSGLLNDGLKRIAGDGVSSIKIVLDYNRVGNGVAVGDWANHPAYIGNNNRGRYEFFPDTQDTNVSHLVDVERNTPSAIQPEAVKFHIQHNLGKSVVRLSAFTGEYDESNNGVGTPRQNVILDWYNDDPTQTITIVMEKLVDAQSPTLIIIE